MQVLNNISAVPFQDRMFNLFHQNDQVAGNTSPLSRVALAAHGQLHAIDDPWRNVERNGFFPTRNTFSATGCAFIGNHLAFAMARSEEHTSELQSLMRYSYAVLCLKKKKQKHR